jgi:hypothetical protein
MSNLDDGWPDGHAAPPQLLLLYLCGAATGTGNGGAACAAAPAPAATAAAAAQCARVERVKLLVKHLQTNTIYNRQKTGWACGQHCLLGQNEDTLGLTRHLAD